MVKKMLKSYTFWWTVGLLMFICGALSFATMPTWQDAKKYIAFDSFAGKRVIYDGFEPRSEARQEVAFAKLIESSRDVTIHVAKYNVSLSGTAEYKLTAWRRDGDVWLWARIPLNPPPPVSWQPWKFLVDTDGVYAYLSHGLLVARYIVSTLLALIGSLLIWSLFTPTRDEWYPPQRA